ncbi:F-box only protein 16-like isoform X1 [Asterias rubens]|uniref:F-box only protein 16-like isoform X1 n=1 Tax=Asterias rubens TaxID=7604 RepID=UPI001455360F|nr:F-box only protein 16-like isoform X1 [Asterias rubens]
MAWSGDQKRLENKKKNLDSKIRFSAWTPMNHHPTNDKVYEERKEVLQKWFDRWTDSQRRAAIVDVTDRCSLGQLQFLKQIVINKLPVVRQDFTRELPRAICLYIFSFLDPRSLCRCAQVCWFWKYLTELDQIWMPKALRLGWYLSFSPSPYEAGVWKRHYLENVRSLHYIGPKESTVPAASTQLNGDTTDNSKAEKGSKRTTPKLKSRPPKPLDHKPWRASAPVADDIKRNNYLDNPDEILLQRQKRLEKNKQMRERRNSASATDLTKEPSAAARKTPGSVSMAYKLKKAKSSSNVNVEEKSSSTMPDRPMWAQNTENLPPEMLVTADTIGGKDASRRPPPLSKNLPRPSAAVKRNDRDLPVGELFQSRGWQPVDSSDDEG